MRILTSCLTLGLLIIACQGNNKEQCSSVLATGETTVSFSFESLETELSQTTSKSELDSFLDKHPILVDNFFHRSNFQSNSGFIDELFQRITNIYIDTLLMEVKSVFGSGEELRVQFESAFTNIKHYYPSFKPPKIQTIISGLETDMYVSDTLVIIGLDYYLGSNARFKPNLYSYLQRRYNKDFIVPSVLLLMGIDNGLNKIKSNDKTVLAEMIAFGKAYYFAKKTLPCIPDSVLIGYTQKEMSGVNKNETLIWSRLVEDQVLFSSSYLVKQKYLHERPKTLEIGVECPGRIGTWVGWQIVNKYMNTHPNVTLPQLMAMEDSKLIFTDSQYKPQFIPLSNRKK